MTDSTFRVPEMSCGHCKAAIEGGELPGRIVPSDMCQPVGNPMDPVARTQVVDHEHREVDIESRERAEKALERSTVLLPIVLNEHYLEGHSRRLRRVQRLGIH